jgi:hypothetical protein
MLKKELKKTYPEDPLIWELQQQCHQGELDPARYYFQHGLLFYKGRIHLGSLGPFQQQILQQFHSTPLSGHLGKHKTFSRIKKEFYWTGLRGAVHTFIRECAVCHRLIGDQIRNPASCRSPATFTNPHPNLDWD